MKVKPEVITNGVMSYIDNELFSQLNGIQGFLAKAGLAFMYSRSNTIAQNILSNKLVTTMGVVDSNGLVDTEEVFAALKTAMQKQGTVVIPAGFADFTLREPDIDVIKSYVEKQAQ